MESRCFAYRYDPWRDRMDGPRRGISSALAVGPRTQGVAIPRWVQAKEPTSRFNEPRESLVKTTDRLLRMNGTPARRKSVPVPASLIREIVTRTMQSSHLGGVRARLAE